jgi:hypothetical protein
MAYSATFTLNHLGGRNYRLVITETESGAATEKEITGLPKYGRICQQRLVKTAGSATTFAPILQEATGAANAGYTVVQATAAADQNNTLDPPAKYVTTDGKLYHRSVCDTGSDTSVTIIYDIQAGW